MNNFKKTQEQLDIIEAAKQYDLIKINAAAGAAKTTSLSMISQEIVCKTLMLVFNKAAQVDAKGRFPSHVETRTTHSLAYQAIGCNYQQKLSRPMGRYVNVAFTGNEIAKYYGIKPIRVGGDGFINSNHLGLLVRKTVASFETSNSDVLGGNNVPKGELDKLQERLPSMIEEEVSKVIVEYAQMLWDDRVDLCTDVLATHDTYLKLFQLSKPQLGFDMILADEFQDTTDCVLDIVMSQTNAKTIVVGDDKQAIYAWRNAINALGKIEAPEYTLSTSFRFGDQVADVARCILRNKKELNGLSSIPSEVGEDVVDKSQPFTVLYRTNAKLLLDAVDSINKGKRVNIEVDVRDFCNMMASAVALHSGDRRKVKHEEIVPFDSWRDLVDESETHPELGRIVGLIKKGQANRVMSALTKHSNSDHAQIVFTTAHKSKGREWDQVILANDFQSHFDSKGKYVGLSTAEQNLLYVAATRAKMKLNINKTVAEVYMNDLVSSRESGIKITKLDEATINMREADPILGSQDPLVMDMRIMAAEAGPLWGTKDCPYSAPEDDYVDENGEPNWATDGSYKGAY